MVIMLGKKTYHGFIEKLTFILSDIIKLIKSKYFSVIFSQNVHTNLTLEIKYFYYLKFCISN